MLYALKYINFFQLPKLKHVVWVGRSGEVAPAYQLLKKLKKDYLKTMALHNVSHSMPQQLQNVIKKQRGKAGYWNSEYIYSIEQ